MKVSNTRTFNRSSTIEPLISLDRPESGRLDKHQYQVFRCRSDPKDKTSTTYEVTVEYFKAGSPEEWINFQKSLEKVFLGQHDTQGPQKYAKARQLLQGEALAAFDAYKAAQDPATFTETNANFDDAMISVTKYVFLERVSQV